MMDNPEDVKQARWRLGVVSYLNAKPLIAGLEHDPDIELILDVPARLPALLESSAVDAALVPIIDLAAPDRSWQVLSDACIGCDGETFTVRVFSRVPPQSIRRLHVDGDSHSSVVLAQIIWQEVHGTRLEVLPYQGNATFSEAVLLIGDKVVKNDLAGFDYECDLGSYWKSMTGLPFVFAAWAGQQGSPTKELAVVLSKARDRGVASAELIAADLGPGMGWPVALAKRYLTTRIKYHLGPPQRQAMERFFHLARKNDLIPAMDELVFA